MWSLELNGMGFSVLWLSHVPCTDSRALPRPAAAEFGSLRTLRVEGASRETHTVLIWCQGRCAPAHYIAKELAEGTRRQHSWSVPKLVTWRNVMWVEFVLWNWAEMPPECWSGTGQTQRRLVLIRSLCRKIKTTAMQDFLADPWRDEGEMPEKLLSGPVFSRVGIPGFRRRARLGAQQRN